MDFKQKGKNVILLLLRHSIIRFGLTGSLGLIIDFSLTWLCKDQLYINKFVANAIGFIAAVISNYLLNRRWTFNSTDPRIGKQFFAFISVSMIGLFLNTAFLYLFVNLFFIPFYVGKAFAVVLVFFWNYTANSLFIFKAKKM